MSTVRGIRLHSWRWFVPGGRTGDSAARRELARVTKALAGSVRTGNRALNEVARLKAQRRRLARHLLDTKDRLELALRVARTPEAQEVLQVVRHHVEEIELLREENSELVAQVRRLHADLGSDLESTLDSAWKMAILLRSANCEIARLKRQRLILARHMGPAMKALRAMRRLLDHLDQADSFWYPFRVLMQDLTTAWDRIRTRAHRTIQSLKSTRHPASVVCPPSSLEGALHG